MLDIFHSNSDKLKIEKLTKENNELKAHLLQLINLEDNGIFTELDQLLNIILTKALIFCPSSSSFFALQIDDTNKFEIRINNNISPQEAKEIINIFNKEYEKWLETESEIIEINNYRLLPLIRRHKAIGILGLKPISDQIPLLSLLIQFAVKTAISLENAMIYDKMFKRLLVLSNVFILGKEIISSIDLESLVDKFLSIVSDGTGSEISALFLVHGKTDLPYFTRLQRKGKSIPFAPNTLDGYTELIQAVHIERKYRLINNVEDTEFAELEIDKVPECKIKNTLVVPLKAHDKMLGILQVANKNKNSVYSTDDIDLLNILSGQLAFVIQNTDLFKNLQKAYFDTLSALTSAIDAKDSYTRGHSERVTELSIKLATECKVSPADIENIKIGGLLHDIGKIGIPEAVLNKPGRLNDDEFKIIKSHPDLGVHILGKVEFLEHIVPIIKHHHERFDGRGYPSGLKGSEIPYLARIVSVVDTFDAMTSTRPYRKALSIEESLTEIERCSGTQFDPEIATTFIKMVQRDGVKYEFENIEFSSNI